MNQFLSILLRNQFNLFYRFGYTFIPNSELIEFDGNISEEVKVKLVKKFATSTPFEYDEEYLILHLDKESRNESDFTQFDIQNVVSVYPLSRQAKVSIESKIDERISLENPVFESILPIIEEEIQNKEVEKAITALWSICGIEEPLDKYLSDIGLETILRGLKYRRSGTNAAKIPGGNYWEYLIAYDRYDYFPNSQLGYLYDAAQVFAYSIGLPSFEGSGIHSFLEKTKSKNPKIKLSEFVKYFETQKQLNGYVSQTSVGDIKQYIIAPLYLMLREEIRNSDDLYQTNFLKYLDFLKIFGDSFKYAVILLGAFFGFRKFYDLYYNTLNLRFYKNYKSPIIITDKPQQIKSGDTIPIVEDKALQVETSDLAHKGLDKSQQIESGDPEQERDDKPYQIKTGVLGQEGVDEPQKVEDVDPEQEAVDESQQKETDDAEQKGFDKPQQIESSDTEQEGDDKPYQVKTGVLGQEGVDEPLKVEDVDPDEKEVDGSLPVESNISEQEIVDEAQQIETVDNKQEGDDESIEVGVPAISDISKDSKIKEESLDQKTEVATRIQKASTGGGDKMENEADLMTQYKKIIRETLEKRTHIKMKEMSEIIKDRIGGKNLQVGEIESVVDEMTDMKSDPIGRFKGIRKAESMREIFKQ